MEKSSFLYNAFTTPIAAAFPEYKKGEPQPYARWIINKISEHSRKEGAYYFLLTRVEAVSFPFFLALSIVQRGGVVIEASFNATHKSLSEEAQGLLYLIGLLFYEVALFIPSVIYPTFLERPAPLEEQIQQKAKEIEILKSEHTQAFQEQTNKISNLEKILDQKNSELTELQNQHNQDLKRAATEFEILTNKHTQALYEQTSKVANLQRQYNQDLERTTTEIETLKNEHTQALQEQTIKVADLQKVQDQNIIELRKLQNQHNQDLKRAATEIKTLRSERTQALQEQTIKVADLQKN